LAQTISSAPAQTLDESLGRFRNTLSLLAQWGCPGFACSEESLATLSGLSKPAYQDTGTAGIESLDQIQSRLGDCRRCPLSEKRTRLVFGEGDPAARLVFVGEGPGLEEDQQGRPFVGPAGQLLDKIIAAMHLRRDQVYICNVVKCRPPSNRNPEPEEVAICKPFLERQLAAIQPQAICTLGAVAAHALLESSTPVSALRGRFHMYKNIPLMPTFHPAYLLRNPEQKRAVWEDLKKIMALLRIPL
jgi:uracil-DNA glycosylase family 4